MATATTNYAIRGVGNNEMSNNTKNITHIEDDVPRPHPDREFGNVFLTLCGLVVPSYQSGRLCAECNDLFEIELEAAENFDGE